MMDYKIVKCIYDKNIILIKVLKMNLVKFRICNTISEIESSECYNNNFELFYKGVEMLKNRLNKKDFSELNNSEREILENIYSIMEIEK